MYTLHSSIYICSLVIVPWDNSTHFLIPRETIYSCLYVEMHVFLSLRTDVCTYVCAVNCVWRRWPAYARAHGCNCRAH